MTDGLPDRSNGYEAAAAEFMSRRTNSRIGARAVRDWARTLPPGAEVLDLGCGHGLPISATLLAEGVTLYGIDASPSMIAAFRARFPDVPAECTSVEDSEFFRRRFDGIIAWGLMFLLDDDAQTRLLAKVSAALKPGGSVFFTSPRQPCEWADNLTGHRSVSLGAAEYRRLIESFGMAVLHEDEDEGLNYYYVVEKPADVGV